MDVLQKHRTSLFNKFSKEFAELDKELRLVLSQREERATREKEVLESELHSHKSKAALAEQLEKENEELRARLATHVVSTADAGTSPPSLRQPSPSRQGGGNAQADVQHTVHTEKLDETREAATVPRAMYDDLLAKHNALSKRYGDVKHALDRMIAKYRGEKDTIDAWIEYYRKQNPNWKDGASKLRSIRGPDDAAPSAIDIQPGAEGLRHVAKDNTPNQPRTSPREQATPQDGNGHDAEAPSRNPSLMSGAPAATSAAHPPASTDGDDAFRRPATPAAGRQTHTEPARQLPMATPIKREAREVYSPDSTQDLSGLAANGGSRNQTLQAEPLPGGDSVAEAESELPVLVSERSLKRKRPLRALSRAATNLGAKLGTASDPVKVKSEPNSSSSIIAAALGETVSDSLDLDEVGRTVRTPRKSRELQQMGLPISWRSAAAESPTRVRRGAEAGVRERFLAQAACFDSEASEDDEMENENGVEPEDIRPLTPAAEGSPRRRSTVRPSHAAFDDGPSSRYERARKRARLSSQEEVSSDTRRPRNALHHAAELHPAAQGQSTRRGRKTTPSNPDTTDRLSDPNKADDHHPLRGANAKPRVRKALQPTSANLRLPRNVVGSRSKTRSKDAKRDRSPAEVDVAKLAFVAEDGDVLSLDASQGHDDDAAAAAAVTTPSRPRFRADTVAASGRIPPMSRLNELLEQPSPAKRLLTPEKPAHSTAAAARNEARRGGKGGRAGADAGAGTTVAETNRRLKDTPAAPDNRRRRAKPSRSPDAAQDALITPPATVDASATARRRKAADAGSDANTGAGAGAEDEAGPLRSRPLSRLQLGDFRVNPHAKANQGANYAFAESVRTNERRQCLPGCTRPECCGDAFRRMIEVAGMPPAPRQPRLRWNSSSPPPPPPPRVAAAASDRNADGTGGGDSSRRGGHGRSRRYYAAAADGRADGGADEDDDDDDDDDDNNNNNNNNNKNDYAYDERSTEDERLLRDFLGDNSAERLRRATPAERRELLLQAQTRRVADAHGKHRQAFARRTTPPGFWRTDMPTTQEMEAYHEEARRLERAKVHERYAEAMRPGGRWVFADEAR